MSATLSTLLAAFLKVGWIALIFNEVRGAILAVPVLYGMYQAGGRSGLVSVRSSVSPCQWSYR